MHKTKKAFNLITINAVDFDSVKAQTIRLLSSIRISDRLNTIFRKPPFSLPCPIYIKSPSAMIKSALKKVEAIVL